jgi:hypothetical protein
LRSLPASRAEGGAALGIMWGEERARRLLAEAGFDPITVRPLPGHPAENCFAARKR